MHFGAMIAYRPMLERECRVMQEPSGAEIRSMMESVVDDFMRAFLQC